MFLIISITALQSLVSQMGFVESRLYSEDTKKTKFDMLEYSIYGCILETEKVLNSLLRI